MTKRARKPGRASGTILIVDHDHALRMGARRVLESAGYRVLDAADGAAAEQIANLFVGPIHLLLIEVEGSGMGGRALADRLRSLRPESTVLVMSSRARSELVRRNELPPRGPFIRKPLKAGELMVTVRHALSAGGRADES
jgi:DNA-binding response OmpR family regulator